MGKIPNDPTNDHSDDHLNIYRTACLALSGGHIMKYIAENWMAVALLVLIILATYCGLYDHSIGTVFDLNLRFFKSHVGIDN